MKKLSLCTSIQMILFNLQVQDSNTVNMIEFSTLSRSGHYEHIIITQDSIFINITERRLNNVDTSYSRKLKSNEWQAIIQSLENISLPEIPDMKSPTMKRAYDGARHSEIIISEKNSNSFNHLFDDENPHEKLNPLMNKIESLLKNYN